jgi:ribonuclease HI
MQLPQDKTRPTPGNDGLWTVHIDGSALPNPGRMAIGAVLTAPDGQRHLLSQDLHASGCNNEAELRALMAALHSLQMLQARRLSVFTDSSILVEQLAALPRPPRPIVRLASLFETARELLAGFEHVQLHWVPRHRNTEADALARAALATHG